jgi:serine phosphatase RsbU (regulator of sigma subunit)
MSSEMARSQKSSFLHDRVPTENQAHSVPERHSGIGNGSMHSPSRQTGLVFALGLVITALLALIAATVNSRNEDRLLTLQVREAGTVLAGILPTIETPIASATAIADATNGATSQFDDYMASYVGGGSLVAYAALCGQVNGEPVQLTSVGTPASASTSTTSNQCRFLSNAEATSGLSVLGFIGTSRNVAYTYTAAGAGRRFGVFGETSFPANRRAAIPTSSAFSDLNFALYLGRTKQYETLLEATVPVPITGRQATVILPFANVVLTLVGTPTQPLGGALSQDLTLIVSIVGVALTLGATFMTERLVRRRRSAVRLADDNRRLYQEQHTLAASLQHALLPDDIPNIDGIELDTHYMAGREDMDIGGDWFDVISQDNDRFIFVVGDVSGRGERAAIVMALLHYAIRAYAADGDEPSGILTKLCRLLRVERDGHFATVLCGSVDIKSRLVTLASAGHFPPLLVDPRGAFFVNMKVGPPIGAGAATGFVPTTVEVQEGSILLAFTDGIVERRGEGIDIGLDRLREAALSADGSATSLLNVLVNELVPDGSDDDIALLGFRWQS